MNNKERFKANIRMVEIELHSYCNRQCWFCPNQFIDRRGPVRWLDEFTLDQLLHDLAYIGYDGIVSFSGNCEPFSQGEDFLEKVRKVRRMLPEAFLITNTNTDYLTPELLYIAADVGLDVIKAQLYFGENEQFSFQQVDEKAIKLIKRLPGINMINTSDHHWYTVISGKLLVHAYGKDWHKVGHNRCDVPVRKINKRVQICGEPIQYIGVNYNGMVTPCCNLRSDYDPHKPLMLGKLEAKAGHIFELYQGVILTEDKYPCSLCMGKSWHPNAKIVYGEIMNELRKRQWLIVQAVR